MPLVGAVDDQIALLQQDVLAVGHGMEGALVHVGQLQGLVGLAGEGEALLLLLVEEGVDAADLDLAAEAELVTGVQPANLPQLLGMAQLHDGAVLVGMQGKPDTGLDAHGLVQIEMLEDLALTGHGEDGHVGMVAEPDLVLAHPDGALAPEKLQLFPALGLRSLIPAPAALGFDDAKGLKG